MSIRWWSDSPFIWLWVHYAFFFLRIVSRWHRSVWNANKDSKHSITTDCGQCAECRISPISTYCRPSWNIIEKFRLRSDFKDILQKKNLWCHGAKKLRFGKLGNEVRFFLFFLYNVLFTHVTTDTELFLKVAFTSLHNDGAFYISCFPKNIFQILITMEIAHFEMVCFPPFPQILFVQFHAPFWK